jgi:D-alanine transaminase
MAEPHPLCYLNGEYLSIDEARISPFDRGFLFGDGVYEVMPVYQGRPFRFGAHLQRMARSLAEIRMEDPYTHAQWHEIIEKLIAPNGKTDQYVYWQVTRGAERGRNHAPLPVIPRTVFAFAVPFPERSVSVLENGIACITAQDTRWARCDIKSTSLLANVLLRQLALDAHASDTLLLRDGELTEASSAAVHVVIHGEIRSPPQSRRILPGTTRGVIEELAQRAGIPHRAMRITEAELRAADEIWITSAVRELSAVTTLDGRAVGQGKPGPLFRRMRDEFERYKAELANEPW